MNTLTFTRIAPGVYDSNHVTAGRDGNYRIVRSASGAWTLAYPGEYRADDAYTTLGEAKEAAQYHAVCITDNWEKA